jgi:hypothetical protein
VTEEPEFLTLDEVLEIHADQILHYGGDVGIRDPGLLESAIAMPRQSTNGPSDQVAGGASEPPQPPCCALRLRLVPMWYRPPDRARTVDPPRKNWKGSSRS